MIIILRLIQAILFLLILTASKGQQVDNVRFEQKGKQIQITYDLIGDTGEKYLVSVNCSQDGGQNWGLPLTHIVGDAGKNVTAGRGKRIVWEVLLDRDRFVGDIMFRVEAVSMFSGNKGQFTDSRDGQIYGWVRIGTQIWMSENLNIGKIIDSGESQADNGVIEKYCYDNKAGNCIDYGGLYQWNEMMEYTNIPGTRGICPEDWHIPTDNEWCILTSYLDNTVDCNIFGYSGLIVGDNLKSSDIGTWSQHKQNLRFSFDYNAKPAGYFNSYGQFGGIFEYAYFGTSSLKSYRSGISRRLNDGDAGISRRYSKTLEASFSVRCLRN